MASAKVLEAKQAKVEALTEQLKKASACVLVDYKGINVADDTKLRKELREAGVSYAVQKNTLIRLAMHNIGFDQFDGVLEGTTAIAISNGDQTAAARILGEYAEKAQKGEDPFLGHMVMTNQHLEPGIGPQKETLHYYYRRTEDMTTGMFYYKPFLITRKYDIAEQDFYEEFLYIDSNEGLNFFFKKACKFSEFIRFKNRIFVKIRNCRL